MENHHALEMTRGLGINNCMSISGLQRPLTEFSAGVY